MRTDRSQSSESPNPSDGDALSRQPSEDARGPLSLVRALSRRYVLVLLAVAILAVIDQAIIQPQLVRLNLYAPAINIAGRQRMLSQKITKQALALATQSGDDAESRRRDLLLAIDEWTTAHRGLLRGDKRLHLEPITDEQTTASLTDLEPKLSAIRFAAVTIARAKPGDAPPAETAAALDIILREEPQYLAGMERVVGMLEASAGRQVDFLRWCGLAASAAVLGLLGGMYFAVLRPAASVIREQIARLAASESEHRTLAGLLAAARDELEVRVDERTGELVAANRTLEHEMAERRAAETRMRELSVELAHASRVTALGQLATGLAHEINQPLASITNYADVLELAAEQGSLDAGQTRSTVAQLKQAALRAGRIVRRMRNFMRPASGTRLSVDLNDLVREVCDLCRPQLEQADVRLTLNLAEDAIAVKVEALEMQQVLVNLVQNAIQALATCGRGERRIEIRTRVADELAIVEVSDTGPGFSGDGEAAFAPFFTTKPEGLGMGLAISRAILERHQGRLWGHNRATGGAVVGFCLPLVSAYESPARQATDCLCR